MDFDSFKNNFRKCFQPLCMDKTWWLTPFWNGHNIPNILALKNFQFNRFPRKNVEKSGKCGKYLEFFSLLKNWQFSTSSDHHLIMFATNLRVEMNFWNLIWMTFVWAQDYEQSLERQSNENDHKVVKHVIIYVLLWRLLSPFIPHIRHVYEAIQ